MFPVNNLTASGNQTSAVLLADGTTVTLTFRYRAAIQRWTVDVAYSKTGFVANGIGLSTHPNLLRDWRDVIPFGLQVSTTDGTDPFMASDLAYTPGGSPPRAIVTMLDGTNGGADVANVEAGSFAAPALVKP
jgi:hypothetical protein